LETYSEARPGLVKQSSIALGFFDGVHPGHQVVIGKAVEEAKRLGVSAGVVTFKDHPRTLTRGQSPLLITVIEQRLRLFEELGVDFALVLQFTEELCRLSPREYVQSVLVDAVGARSISVGHNHHFGRDREGDASLLQELGSKLNFSVHACNMIEVEGVEVSSSTIRELVRTGEMLRATKLLSRPFALYGTVVEGDKRGAKLGFPTANMSLYQFQIIPQRGVYVGTTRLSTGQEVPCVINVGLRPTFKGADGEPQLELSVESHLLDFEGNLYGSEIEVSFLSYLRAEQKFDGPDSLKKQIETDVRNARRYLSEYEAHRDSVKKNEPEIEPEQKLLA
jgi:riboflavin kinase / FMN adenylyltransferase